MSILNRLLLAGCLLVSTCFGTACGRAPHLGSALQFPAWGPSVRATTRSETWTLLVHLAADNDLYEYGVGDLNEMEAALPRDGSLEVLVLFDGMERGDSAVYRVRRDPAGYNDTIVSEKLDVPSVVPPSGEINSGDRATVQRFLEWGARNARGQRTMITFWDHGTGIFANSGSFMPTGFGYDDDGSHLTTADLSGLCAAFRAARGRPADIVGFDACLMAHGELVYQLDGLASLFIASEHLVPATGWDYEGWFARWERSGNRTPMTLANTLIDAFAYTQELNREKVTMSVIDVNAFNRGVVPALEQFVEKALRALPGEKAAFQRARARTMFFFNRDCADLGSFLSQLERFAKAPEVTESSRRLRDVYSRAILRDHHTEPMYAGATGAVLYFPAHRQPYNPAYDQPGIVRFAERNWRAFLKALRS